MKRDRLEILILAAGGVIICVALFFRFFTDMSIAKKLLVMNIIIMSGFLVYIAYHLLSTNQLNREIRQHLQHISSLKSELNKKKQEVTEKQAQVESLEGDLSTIRQELETAQEHVAELEKQVNDLQSPDTGQKL